MNLFNAAGRESDDARGAWKDVVDTQSKTQRREKNIVMAKIEASVVVDRPVEDVWKFMSDMSNDSKWNPDTVEVRQTSAGPLRVGTTLERVNPKRTFRIRVSEYEPNRKFSYEVVEGPAKGSAVRYSMETVEGKTNLNIIMDPKFNGFYKLMEPLHATRAKREFAVLGSNIKRILESEPRP
jgi:uncharacterized protein YndB with AHSA1/START domain